MTIGDDILILIWELIYSMLSWNAPAKLRDLIIYVMSRSDKYHLKKIIQPGRLNKFRSKSCWESCAKIISSKNMSKMSYDVIDRLFVWLQDMNGPGAEIVYDYFLSNPCDYWIKCFEKNVQEAYDENDDQWLTSFHNLILDVNPQKEVFTDIEIFNFISTWDYDDYGYDDFGNLIKIR